MFQNRVRGELPSSVSSILSQPNLEAHPEICILEIVITKNDTMKYLHLLSPILLLLFPVEMSDALQQRVDLDKGLIAYYSFNDCDARDESGYGSDGDLYNVNCWCGIEDEGLLFDGIRSYVEFSGRVNKAFNTTDFSISFYVKPERDNIFQQSLLSKRSACDSIQMFDIRMDTRNKKITTEVFEKPYKSYSDISPDYESNGWVHYALVRKGRYAYTYINGAPQREGFRCSGVDISNETILSFSNSPCLGSGGARRFKGILDELKVYERALSSEEVLQLYEEIPIENANSDCYT